MTLNIGCGFGSFERYLLERFPGLEIIGITPSYVQEEYIRKCMEDSSHVFDENSLNP